MLDAYDRLVTLLTDRGIAHRFIDHEPEGRTELVSRMRGHDVMLAAKCMILMVKLGKKTTRFVLAVVPGGAKVDFAAVQREMHATYVSFASVEAAERLSGAVVGTVLPFTFTPDLELIVDPALLAQPEMYFNAGRLDRSAVIATVDYAAAIHPRVRARRGRAAALAQTTRFDQIDPSGFDAAFFPGGYGRRE